MTPQQAEYSVDDGRTFYAVPSNGVISNLTEHERLVIRIVGAARRAPAPTSEPGARDAVLEEAATYCELVGKDWDDSADYAKMHAAKYLANCIRRLATPASPAVPAAPLAPTLAEFEANLRAAQKPLDADFSKILHDNLPDLYVYDDPAPLVAQASPQTTSEGEFASWSRKQLLEYIEYLRTTNPQPKPCPNADEYSCSNRAQCWEPCGELGHSAEHARGVQVAQASPELPEPFGWAIRGTILRERFQLYLASDEADRNYHDHAKNYRYQGEAVHEVKPLYEHPPETSPLVEDAQRIVAGKVEPGPWKHPGARAWSDEEREIYRANLRRGDRCPVCSVTMGGKHFPGCTRSDFGVVFSGTGKPTP